MRATMTTVHTAFHQNAPSYNIRGGGWRTRCVVLSPLVELKLPHNVAKLCSHLSVTLKPGRAVYP